MMRSRRMYIWACLLPLSSGGCIVGAFGSKVWTQPVVEERTIDATDLEALEVRTHNGTIRFAGQPGSATEAAVKITTKAGGRTMEDAERALEAIDVFVEPVGSGKWRIGWRWDGAKHLSWGASVSFDITAPGTILVDGETHNGAIRIEGAERDVRVVTHNGSIHASTTGGELFAKTHNGPVEVDASGQKLHAETHNGRVTAVFAGEDVTLISHNGRIVAGLGDCGAIDGRIETHNGGVELIVGERTSTNLTCHSHNGGIRFDIPVQGSSKSRRHLKAKLGSGDGNLSVTTHNGAVRIKDSEG